MLEFPTTTDLTHLVRNRVVNPARFQGRLVLPIRDVFAASIEVDVLGAVQGMTSAHNLNAEPRLVAPPGMKTVRYGTGHWKETMRINEQELLEARLAGSYNDRAGRQLVVSRALALDTRVETRVEWCIWQALCSGSLAVDENGVKYTVTFNFPASHLVDLSALRPWSDAAADPLRDLADLFVLFEGSGAEPRFVWFNRSTAALLANHPNVVGRLKYQAVFDLSPDNVGDALGRFFPNVGFRLYNQGYGDEAGVFRKFIPDFRLVITGDDDDPTNPLGDFGSTISLHNGSLERPLPGKFAVVSDHSSAENPYIDLTQGIYGLPRIYHPDWVVSAKVA